MLDFVHVTNLHIIITTTLLLLLCVQCFDAVGWVVEKASCLKKTDWWDAGMVICMGQGADLHMAQLMPLPLSISCSSKSRLVSLFWYQLTQVDPDKIQRAAKRL